MILNYAPVPLPSQIQAPSQVRWPPKPRSREAAQDCICSLSLTDAQEPEKEHSIVRRRALFLLERGLCSLKPMESLKKGGHQPA